MAVSIKSNKTEPARLMIIDDDQSITGLISEIAVESGYIVQCVNKSQEISERYRTFDPHMIFLDLDLVDRDGVEVMQFLSIEECLAKIVIISGMDAVTRESSQQIGIQMNLNVIHALGKPFNLEQVRELLYQ